MHQGFTLISTQKDSNRRIIVLLHHISCVIVNIHLHLPDVLMGKVARFQVNQDKAFENIIVENEINIKMLWMQIFQ